MKNSETGEYELVVGNGQLLCAFFIVVLLCGVAFGLGYMIGQNSQRPKPQTDTAANTAPNFVLQTPVQPAPSSAAPAQAAAEQPSADSAAQSEAAAPQPTTQPARETPTGAAPAALPPQPAQAPAPEAPAGSYWQVAAFKASDEAQPIMHTLKDGGMPVIAKMFPDGLVHVLVGPFADARSLSNARQELTTRFGIKTVYSRQLPLK